MARCSDYIWYYEYFQGAILEYNWTRQFQCSRDSRHEGQHQVILAKWFKQNIGTPVEVLISWPANG